jgi:ferric-dicitrate binding protein FerR (iron transport regulator)
VNTAVSKKIRMQAARWLIELELAEEITTELWCRFEAWLNRSPAHRATYLQIERSWHDADDARVSHSPCEH